MTTTIRTVTCSGTCGQPIAMSWSSSCEHPDGTAQGIYCGGCWSARTKER